MAALCPESPKHSDLVPASLCRGELGESSLEFATTAASGGPSLVPGIISMTLRSTYRCMRFGKSCQGEARLSDTTPMGIDSAGEPNAIGLRMPEQSL